MDTFTQIFKPFLIVFYGLTPINEFFPLNKENSRECVCACVHAKSFSHIQLFATLWI